MHFQTYCLHFWTYYDKMVLVIYMNYKKTILKEIISVKSIVTVHYFEYGKNYHFTGEEHNFWELIYVDRGTAEIFSEDSWQELKQGEIAFHKPGEFHNVRSNGRVAPNLVIIAFDCSSPTVSYFEGKNFLLNEKEKKLLAVILTEAREAFSSPIGNPDLKKLERNKNPKHSGCEQMIKLSLEQLLISLLRSGEEKRTKAASVLKAYSESDTVSKAIEFLTASVNKSLRFPDVTAHLKVSATGLKSVFKKQTGMGVMEYYRTLKADRAKILIRESGMNFTQIADSMGYESIHHFSRQFKKTTGMTPTEYSETVRN